VDYRPLGRTGISVSQMCLGAMMFGAFGNPDHDDAVRIIHHALDAGINFIDTADGYSGGESEQIIGQALAGGRRESVVLAVKFGPPFDEDPNHRGASRRWITEGVEGSLSRLQTDWIDLYQVGVPDPNTDIDETLGALSDLVHAGKIRSFGTSKVPASEIVEAQWAADRRGHGRFRTEQPPYSMLTRAIEYDVLPTSPRHGMGVMTYSPLGGGWLSGKYRKGQEVSGPGSAARLRRFPGRYDASDPSNAAKLDAADALGALADEAGLTLIQMAVAFATRHPAVTSAIIGPRTMEHLNTYLAADGIDLSADVLDRIDEIVPPGVTINVADNMWNFGTPSLSAAFRRR
jgi:aryl-alcohol dehydrogenase-like predicted oxidoreductase